MDDKHLIQYVMHSTGAQGACAAALFILPVPAAIITSQSLPVTLALAGSTFVIEYGAAPIGIAGGLHPLFVLFVLACIALGVTLLLFTLCESLGGQSPWFARFLDRTRTRAQSSVFLAKYGIYSLVPLVIFPGFYVCAPVAWLAGWRRSHAVLLIMAGYLAISLATMLATLGILRVFFP
jgi:hypothetical protein